MEGPRDPNGLEEGGAPTPKLNINQIEFQKLHDDQMHLVTIAHAACLKILTQDDAFTSDFYAMRSRAFGINVDGL